MTNLKPPAFKIDGVLPLVFFSAYTKGVIPNQAEKGKDIIQRPPNIGYTDLLPSLAHLHAACLVCAPAERNDDVEDLCDR